MTGLCKHLLMNFCGIIWILSLTHAAKLAPRSNDFSVDAPEIDFSKAELLDEIGSHPDARALQQANGMPVDESQFVVEANNALILPSAEHDGIPLRMEDWPVHPEDPVDSFEALRDRLTDAVETIFPERAQDYQESQRRAVVGVKGQTPIADASRTSRTPSVMSEIEDLLAEVSHHGLAKGAEVSVEGETPTIPFPENTCFWMFVGWLGSVSVFAVPAAVLYLYVKCTGYEICALGPCATAKPASQPCSHSGGNLSASPEDEADDQPGGADNYFVVHPYGDGNLAPGYGAVNYGSEPGSGSQIQYSRSADVMPVAGAGYYYAGP